MRDLILFRVSRCALWPSIITVNRTFYAETFPAGKESERVSLPLMALINNACVKDLCLTFVCTFDDF